MKNLKDQFLLAPEIIFLNHGSFGACPRPVFEAYQSWQRILERQPVEFLDRRASDLMEESRTKLAEYLGADADDVVYFPNPTTAINMVARSLSKLLEGHTGRALEPGDEILASDHEYGAMDRTWRFICRQHGAIYRRQPIPLPIKDPDEIVDHIWAGVNERTRVIFISHITSPTALIFPVEEVCKRARQAGILTIVDGAHAVGQITLNIKTLGADFYTGACHKWLCAPKGAAFLYARKGLHLWLDPLVISWGYEPEEGFGSGIQFIDYHEWQGTRDLAAFLCVPTAIEFQEKNQWDAVSRRCHNIAVHTRDRINKLTGLDPICSKEIFGQMFAARLPQSTELKVLKETLYDHYCIEVPIIKWNEEKLIRVSLQGYNLEQDVDILIEALAEIIALHPAG